MSPPEHPASTLSLEDAAFTLPTRARASAASVVFPWRGLLEMTKPTIGLLVVVTAFPTLLMAGSGAPSLSVVLATLVGTFLASSSAGILNHLCDRELDARMARTRGRPLPARQVEPLLAVAVAALLGGAGYGLMAKLATPLAANLSVLANAFYVLVYTVWLKPRTHLNIVIGGAAGAVGPLIGWAAVANETSWVAWLLFALIFLWTPPHFWALAIKYREDYRRAGIPMLPVTHGLKRTRREIFWYSVSMLLPVAGVVALHAAGWIFGIVAAAATLGMVLYAWRLLRSTDERQAMPLFHYSCLYLFVVFGALTIDRVVALA
jgi:protoheme IX farnesyltransferase